MSHDATWKQFHDDYLYFLGALSRSQLITQVANHAFQDFPKNLHERFRNNVELMLASLTIHSDEHLETRSTDLEFTTRMFPLLVASAQRKENIGRAFTDTLLATELISVYAHAESFLRDCIRALCREAPGIITSRPSHDKPSRTLAWEDAFAAEDLFEYCLSLYVKSIANSGGITKQLEWFTKQRKLHIATSRERLNRINTGEQVRHLFVHRRGIVDHEFLRNTTLPECPPGHVFPLSAKMVDEITEAVGELGSDLFVSIKDKHFGDVSHGIWWRWGWKKETE
jgi:hypothetical protein